MAAFRRVAGYVEELFLSAALVLATIFSRSG